MFGIFKPRDKSSRELIKYIKQTFNVRPKHLEYYSDAFRHKSVARDTNKADNERLEFLGDAVLDIIVAEQLYELYPNKTEGELTQIKSRIVNRKSLGEIGRKLGLEEKVEFVDGKYVNKNTICGNALEAVVGAIYADRGFDVAKSAVRYILKNTISYKEIEKNDPDYKSQILVWSQKNKNPISFEQIDVEDLGHEKIYHFQVRCNDNILGTGKGKSKKKAEQAASKKAIEFVQSNKE